MNDPEKKIIIKVSLSEAALILELRKWQYGDFRIKKAKGKYGRLVYEGSKLINENDGLKLSLDKDFNGSIIK